MMDLWIQESRDTRGRREWSIAGRHRSSYRGGGG